MESFDSRATQVLSRRGFMLSILMALPFPILLGRLYYLQNVVGSRYSKLAEQNRIQIRPIRPERGRFLDRFGRTFAEDHKAHRLVLVPEQCPNPPQILKRIAQLTPLKEAVIKKILKDIKRRAPFTPVTVVRTLPFDNLARVQINQPDLPGVDLKTIPVRHYNDSELLSHITGYVGRSDYDRREKVEGWAPDFPVGRQGMERLYEDRLGGIPGLKQVESNAQGRPIREVGRQEPKKGEDLVFSLNLEVQKTAWEALSGHNGSVVVMDVRTGGVIAAVSRPTFDANLFNEGIDEENWARILNDENNPLLNRAFQGIYSPGSTYKCIVALAALEEGVITPQETMRCVGHTELGDRRFHCWKKHGKVDFLKALQGSCDIYYYEIAKRLGPDKMAKYARMFGLGQTSDIGLPEKPGLVPTREWKRRVKKEAWAQGESLVIGIGQGFMLATPLQMAQMTARIATGKEIRPVMLTEQEIDNEKPNLSIKEEHLKLVRQGMFDVVNKWGGTARKAQSKKFTVAGKTGTVQVISQRIDEDTPMHMVPKKKRPHAMFIAYAPYEKPKFAISVVVENGGSGGSVASPIARKVLEKAYESMG